MPVIQYSESQEGGLQQCIDQKSYLVGTGPVCATQPVAFLKEETEVNLGERQGLLHA